MDNETITKPVDVTTDTQLSPSGAGMEETVGVMSNGEETGDSVAVDELRDAREEREALLRRASAEGLAERYPDFDPDAALAHPVFGALARGEATPTLRQIYEMTHMEALVEARVQDRLNAEVERALAVAIPEAVSAAVAESEKRLLDHIRARGQRPAENGTAASAGVRMHPAVDRLTRRERAMLAERAGRGETVRL